MKQSRIISIAALVAFSALSAATNDADPDAVKKTPAATQKIYASSIETLNKTFASGNSADLNNALSEDFAIESFPANQKDQVLKQVFVQAKGKISGLTVINERKTATGHDLTLKASNGNRFDVSVDRKGKFTALRFFAPEPPKKAAPVGREKISAPSFETLPFERFGAGGLIMAKAAVNGIEGYIFVDSGAERSMLNSQVIPGLKGEKIGTSGINGEITEASIVPVESMKLGKVEFKGIKALYQPLNHLTFGKKDIKMLGLIGYKELAHFEIILNYPKQTITLLALNEKGERVGDAKMPEPVKTIKFTYEAHLPVINCEVGGEKLRMGLDTGVEVNLLHRKHSKKLGALLQNKQAAESISADGQPMKITVGTMPESKVDGRTYANMKTMFTDISHITGGVNGMKIDGMIGYQFLVNNRLVSINFKKKQITLW